MPKASGCHGTGRGERYGKKWGRWPEGGRCTQKTGIMCAEHIWLRAWAGCRRSCRFNADTMQRARPTVVYCQRRAQRGNPLSSIPPPACCPSQPPLPRPAACTFWLARSLSSFALGRSIWLLEILWMPSMLITQRRHLSSPSHSSLLPFLCLLRVQDTLWSCQTDDDGDYEDGSQIARDLAPDADKTPAQRISYWFPVKLVCMLAPKGGGRGRDRGRLQASLAATTFWHC